MELTPQLFAIFAGLVEDECGVHYSHGERALFETKLVTHATELGYDSLLDYYYKLRYEDPDRSERHALVEAVLVHETYFFREAAPLVQLVDGYLADTVRAKGRARVWCAAASTGEEPLTIAMLLDDRGLLDKVELVATDLSDVALATARKATYGKRSLRAPYPETLAQRYLEATPRGLSVVPRIREAVRYATANLVEPATFPAGRFDAIVCRNVLIYFRDEHIARVIDALRATLAPGGVIAVGVSESLMRFGTGVACEERGGSFFYRSAS